MAKNRCIGKADKIPWYYKEDLKWFKEFTQSVDGNKIIVMGRKTYQALPLLKNRTIYVLSKSMPVSGGGLSTPEGSTMIHVINDRKNLPSDKELIITGGKAIYEEFMPVISEFYVTHLNEEHEGDTFMPAFEHLFSKKETVREFDFGKVVKYVK